MVLRSCSNGTGNYGLLSTFELTILASLVVLEQLGTIGMVRYSCSCLRRTRHDKHIIINPVQVQCCSVESVFLATFAGQTKTANMAEPKTVNMAGTQRILYVLFHTVLVRITSFFVDGSASSCKEHQ
jgi:hypothetical protein